MEDNIEEERRLVYVGITRAKKKLYISYVERRNRFGQVNYSAPSRFLEEMELLKIEKINNLNDFMPKKQGLLSNTIQEEELNINERYFHEKFGEGILKEIEEVAGKKIITIEFFNGEKKRFLANRTPLRKITSQ
jgi:DNA helicase-2/ATP-dependent DNA helicase PcrA